jgi:hypothetical protein
MTKFEIDFLVQRKNLDIKKKDVASALNITAPTLQSRIRNPHKITIQELDLLTEMGFEFNLLTTQKNEKRKLKRISKTIEN